VAVVNYSNGSVLGELELDATAAQSLFAAQEVFDDSTNAIKANASLRWDALNRRIINVAAPVDSTDAVNKSFADGIVADATAQANAAASSASAASASASDAALSAAKLKGTSTTSLLIAVASKTFTTQAGKSFDEGAWVLITSDANEANYMHGQVTTYSGTTLTVNVTNIGGAGTFADWTIRVSGTRGAIGVPGAPGTGLILQEEGTPLTSRPNLNFIGAIVTASDNAGTNATDITVTNPVPAHEAAGDPHTQYTLFTELTAHEGAADPHTVYQKESEKDAVNGYAGLGATGRLAANTVETTSIVADSVTFGKITPLNANVLIGRSTSVGNPTEITLGTNLSMAGTVLNASGGAGGDSLIYEFW
jgi:hypothetical protein